MNLALFDFDGTITSKDSMIDFIRYAVGWKIFFSGFILLSPILIAFKLKMIPNWKAKELVLSYFFNGWESYRFEEVGKRYSKEKLPKIIRTSSLEKIEWHKDRGHLVVVVTAAIETWIKEWTEYHGLELLATRLEVIDDKLTGKISGKNCYGEEKVKRIREKYNLKEFKQIYVYGDSSGDKEMFALANVFKQSKPL